MTIYFFKGLTRNPEIGNTPIWVLFNIWRLGQVRNTKFGMDVFNKILLNAANCQGYNFTLSKLLKENQQGGVKLPYPPLTRFEKRNTVVNYWIHRSVRLIRQRKWTATLKICQPNNLFENKNWSKIKLLWTH